MSACLHLSELAVCVRRNYLLNVNHIGVIQADFLIWLLKPELSLLSMTRWGLPLLRHCTRRVHAQNKLQFRAAECSWGTPLPPPPLWRQQPGKLLYLRPWYRAFWIQRRSLFSVDRCAFCFTAECVILRRPIRLTEAALFEFTFRYPLWLLRQPSCLCARKFNLFLFQPRKVHYYKKMKGGIILLGDLRGKWISQRHSLLFSSHYCTDQPHWNHILSIVLILFMALE